MASSGRTYPPLTPESIEVRFEVLETAKKSQDSRNSEQIEDMRRLAKELENQKMDIIYMAQHFKQQSREDQLKILSLEKVVNDVNNNMRHKLDLVTAGQQASPVDDEATGEQKNGAKKKNKKDIKEKHKKVSEINQQPVNVEHVQPAVRCCSACGQGEEMIVVMEGMKEVMKELVLKITADKGQARPRAYTDPLVEPSASMRADETRSRSRSDPPPIPPKSYRFLLRHSRDEDVHEHEPVYLVPVSVGRNGSPLPPPLPDKTRRRMDTVLTTDDDEIY